MVRALVQSRVPLANMIYIVALMQGVEYCLRPANTALVLNVIEGSIPFWAWGVWLALPAVVGMVAHRFRIWGLAVMCHAVIGGAYVGLAFGFVLGVVSAGQYWGWQSFPSYLFLAVLHALWAVIDAFRERLE